MGMMGLVNLSHGGWEGMELFAVKSPDMAYKTMLMMMIAYNLLRCLMQSAARDAEVPVHHLSFKGTLDLVTSYYGHFKSIVETCKKEFNTVQKSSE